MHADRLLNVAKALRESPNPEQFTMGRVSNPCGTPACAIGHYVARPDLQSDFKPVPPDHHLMSDTGGTGHVLLSDGKAVFFSSKQLRDHFDLDECDFDDLFNGSWGCDDARTALQAAEYIENFVARRTEVTQS